MTDPTRRFSSRVENYTKYRPSYPPAVLDLLKADCGLTPDALIADIGCGTGLLTELFLKNGNRVFGVEPNRDMRAAAERLLAEAPGFTSVDGTAEATSLPTHSVDMVTAGQAFHWFDSTRARAEFARILKSEGWVVLVWNDRQTEATPFLAEYERLLQTYSTEYAQVNHKQIGQAAIAAFFAPGSVRVRRFQNQQLFDFQGLKGRLLSSSYTPEPGHQNYQPMLDALGAIFDAHQRDGQVTFEYATTVFYGQLSSRD